MPRISRIVAMLTLAVGILVPSLFAGATDTLAADDAEKNCATFATQAEAQAWFTAHGGSKANNVDALDADHDGIACEHLGSASGSATGSAAGSADDGGIPWARIVLGVLGVAVIGGIVGALVTIARKRQDASTSAAFTPMMTVPDASPTEIPCDPPPPGWPTVSAMRAAELVAMPEAAYHATPEWMLRADAVLAVTGSRCQLCNADLMLPDQVRHRTTERRGRELPCDLIVLCDRCAAQLEK